MKDILLPVAHVFAMVMMVFSMTMLAPLVMAVWGLETKSERPLSGFEAAPGPKYKAALAAAYGAGCAFLRSSR